MIEVHDNTESTRFEIDLGGGEFAIAEYTLPAGRIMFTHTEVPPHHEGEGLGTMLIRAGVEAARQSNRKVIPICPFFAAWFTRHPEEKDLLDPAWRVKLGLE